MIRDGMRIWDSKRVWDIIWLQDAIGFQVFTRKGMVNDYWIVWVYGIEMVNGYWIVWVFGIVRLFGM